MESVFNGDVGPGIVRWQDGQTERGDPESRILHLSSWMMILGTVRLICAFGEYVDAFLATVGRGKINFQILGRFLQDYPPAIVVGLGWPLALGLILRRTRSLNFVRASAATFLILSVGGMATLLPGLFLKTEPDVVFGSFTVSRWGLLTLQPASLMRAMLGLVQLALELLTALSAFAILRSTSPVSEDQVNRIASPRRSLQGRLAIYVTLAFLVLSCRQMAWSTYLAVLNKSTIFRQFVLKNDRPTRAFPRTALINVPAMTPQMSMEFRLNECDALASLGRYADATQAYLNIIHEIESRAIPATEEAPANVTLARALNNLAWLLATCEDAKIRRAEDSVTFARRALTLTPEDGNYWNTLGVAHYRTKAWDRAIEALERSMELGDGQGTPHDWYFLAMIDARRGERERAIAWYERAVAWSKARESLEPELYRFQVEAAEQLGLTKPSPPENLRMGGDGRRSPTRMPNAKRLGILRGAFRD